MKNFLTIVISLLVIVKKFAFTLVKAIVLFLKRFYKSVTLMTRLEKRLALFLLLVAFILFGQRTRANYINNTKLVPAYGETYKEVIVGELKYLSPILPVSDVEKSTSRLIFSGLVRIDKNNNVTGDLAESWVVSEDKLKYTFILRDDAFFHDDTKVTADDIVYTVNQIKDPANQSPLFDAWSAVDVNVKNEREVEFNLPRAYGPFIYNCDFGILPSHLTPEDFNKRVIGSGPYKFSKLISKDGKISEVILGSNQRYYFGRPYIEKIEMRFEKEEGDAELVFEKENFTAISGYDDQDAAKHTIGTNKKLGLIFNLRNPLLADKNARGKIVKGEKFEEPITLVLAALDCDLHREKAEQLKKDYSEKGINLDIKYYDPVEYKEVIDKKDYGAILYGFDFNHDRDPYVFWHSSQMNKLNLAGYSNKKSDILLEDSRMITDPAERNAKYDQFFTELSNEYLAVFFETVDSSYSISDNVKGTNFSSADTEGKYFGVEKWYIKEKRVKK